jgi:hypothetical protein
MTTQQAADQVTSSSETIDGSQPTRRPGQERIPTSKQGATNLSFGPTRTGQSPLFLDEWLEFNRQTFGLEPRRVGTDSSFRELDQPMFDAVIYLDRKGRVRRPWRNPYLPVNFTPSPTPYAHKAEHQWHEQADQLVQEVRERGVVNEITLTPNIQDVRPWQWAGYRVNVNYTFQVDFPFDMARMSKQVRARLRRCERDGFRAEPTTDIDAVFACLKAAEARQGYNLGLTLADLLRARDLLGEHLHAYAAYAPDGEMASAAVTLFQGGSNAIGWLGGTRAEYLSSGVADMVEYESYVDLEKEGATGIDLCGANMRSIAAYKSSLGARLVPYYAFESYSPSRLGKWLQAWWDFERRRPGM